MSTYTNRKEKRMSKTLYVDDETKRRLERVLPTPFSMILFLKLLLWVWARAGSRQREQWRREFLTELEEQGEAVD